MEHIRVVAVIGAGIMGRGVCVALCQAGLRVILIDRSEEVFERTLRELRDDVRMYSMLTPDTSITVDEIMDRTVFSSDYDELADVDLVVENATEDLAVKEPVYECIEHICRGDTIIAANTSAIPITRLAALTSRPDKVIGMHFMNPVPLKPTVEVIRGYQTSDATVGAVQAFLSNIGKKSIVVNDSPGFVTNRVMMLMINEAIFLLQERVATAANIDRLFIECFGHKMGPLETADLIGLDTVLLSIEVLYDEFKDSKYRPCPLLSRMVNAGLHGRKSGRGFYEYATGAGS